MIKTNLFLARTYERIRGYLPALAMGCTIILIVFLIGGSFFFRGRAMMETQLKDKLRSTAAAAAMQFDGDNITRIKDGMTMTESPVLRDTVTKLQSIRETISSIRFAYIMKRSDDPARLKFVADADLALTKQQLDANQNGIVDANEQASKPGDLYDWSQFPVLDSEAFLHPTVDAHIATDQWGILISGYAPIRNKEGQTVAVLGLDMAAKDYSYMTESVFSPIAFLLLMLATLSIGFSFVFFLWRRRIELLEKLETERSGLLRLAFHQLGGPLTIINWSLEELEMDGPQSIQRTIINIQEGVKRLSGILKMLKDADIVHAKKLEYKPELVSLASILKDVVKDAGTRLIARHQRIKLELAENITMNLDTKLIASVAQELLTNAIDFSPEGAEIVVRSRTDGNTASFEIEDHGCGIPREDIDRIFDEFTRGSNATHFKADGNGLGLYIVHGVIERAGGKISVKSKEGHGTCVTVRLPLA